MADTDTDEKAEIRKDFADAVNMSPSEIEDFLETEESKKVGWKGEDGDGGGESVGHKSGRRIIAIKRKTKDELTDSDYDHMRKVVGYVHRHCAQGGPTDDKAHSAWRYSLMNWGHDPLK